MAAQYRDMMEYYTIWAHQIKTPIAAMHLLLREEDSPHSRALEEELQRQQELLLQYVRQAVTQENVNRFASEVLDHRETVSALELASTQSQEFIKIIGLHTYSQSPDRNYEISVQGEWVVCNGFRFQQFWVRRRS